MSRFLFLALLASLVAGCAVQPSAESAPTPMALRVEITSAVEWLRLGMADCAQLTPGLTLTVQPTALTDQSLEEADVLLRWSSLPAASGFTVEIGKDSLVAIVNPANPVAALEAASLKDIYTGLSPAWTDADGAALGAVQPWVYPVGDDSHSLLTSTLLADTQITTTARIAPNPAAMIEAVAADPQAVGFVPSRWVDASVKAVAVLGYANDLWILPILAVTPAEPAGPIRDWLLCVQGKPGN